MSRTLTAGMQSHLAGRTHTRCRMLRLELVDGTVLGFTDHNRDLAFDLGDGSVTYQAGTGILTTDLSLSLGFSPDDFEVRGPIGALITRAAVIGGRFDDATFRLFEVNWSDLTDGPIRLIAGRVELARAMGGEFVFSMHSEISRFSQEVGRTITGYCDADFGDARCGKVPETLAGTITAVADEFQITISFTGTFANDYWNKGLITFDDGELMGTRPIEILDWSSAGVIKLWAPLPALPQVGDNVTLSEGCEKIRPACKAKNNIANFRGFPDVPGSDRALRYANPGS